jgi:hypothetical protein
LFVFVVSSRLCCWGWTTATVFSTGITLTNHHITDQSIDGHGTTILIMKEVIFFLLIMLFSMNGSKYLLMAGQSFEATTSHQINAFPFVSTQSTTFVTFATKHYVCIYAVTNDIRHDNKIRDHFVCCYPHFTLSCGLLYNFCIGVGVGVVMARYMKINSIVAKQAHHNAVTFASLMHTKQTLCRILSLSPPRRHPHWGFYHY